MLPNETSFDCFTTFIQMLFYSYENRNLLIYIEPLMRTRGQSLTLLSEGTLGVMLAFRESGDIAHGWSFFL